MLWDWISGVGLGLCFGVGVQNQWIGLGCGVELGAQGMVWGGVQCGSGSSGHPVGRGTLWGGGVPTYRLACRSRAAVSWLTAAAVSSARPGASSCAAAPRRCRSLQSWRLWHSGGDTVTPKLGGQLGKGVRCAGGDLGAIPGIWGVKTEKQSLV